MYCMAVRAGADAEGCYLGDGGLVLLHELIHLLLVLLLARLQVVLLLLETTQLLIQLREKERERERERDWLLVAKTDLYQQLICRPGWRQRRGGV